MQLAEKTRCWDKVTGVIWALWFSSELSRSLFSPPLPVGGLLFLSAVAHGHLLSMRLPMLPYGIVRSAILQLSRNLLPPFSGSHTSPSACRRMPETQAEFICPPDSDNTWIVHNLTCSSHRSPFWTYPAPLSLLTPKGPSK